jgi:hypothetical protein
MAADVSKIHLGPGDLWVTPDLTAAPAKGIDLNDPTTSSLMAMTTGFAAPSTSATPAWRYVGFTNGAATLTYRPTFYMVETEQTFAPVITTPTAEEATLAFTMLEADYRNLSLGMAMATTEVNAGAPVNNAVFVGGKTSVNLNVLVLVSRKRSGTGYFVLTLYSAYSAEGVALPFERRAEMRIAVTVRALADATRPVGDQLFQLVDYAANPA